MKRHKLPETRYVSHGDGIHNTGNVDNNIVSTLYGDMATRLIVVFIA